MKKEYDIPIEDDIREEVEEMCNLSQGIVESTTERNTLDSIRNLMETLNLTTEEAMVALKIPEAESPKIFRYVKRTIKGTREIRIHKFRFPFLFISFSSPSHSP